MEKFKILVVDDDVNLAFLLQQRLESEGFSVESANSVPAAYLIYQTFKPDLVLTDIGMGDESGFDLMQRIRDQTPRIKTIYMTGDLTRYRSALEQEHNQHYATFLSKPFGEDILLESISARVRSRDQLPLESCQEGAQAGAPLQGTSPPGLCIGVRNPPMKYL